MSAIEGVPDSITDPLWQAVGELYGETAANPSQQGFTEYAAGFWKGVRFSTEYPKLVARVRRILWLPERYDLEHEEAGHVHPPDDIDVLAGKWAEVVYPMPDDDTHLDWVRDAEEKHHRGAKHIPAKWDADWDLRDLVWELDETRGDDNA